MATIPASWRKVADSNTIKRSSQILIPTKTALHIFSGEINPREPVDNALYTVTLNPSTSSLSEPTTTTLPSAPAPRVGAASATLNDKTYLFSGRAGVDPAPLHEQGALHVLDHSTGTPKWTTLAPADSAAPYPEARSYHTMTGDAATGTLYLHAGCGSSGRLSDLWSFSVSEQAWKQLAEAPGSGRGGSSIAFSSAGGGRVYRMNGFDGKKELGLEMDVYDVSGNAWETRRWKSGEGPAERSVASLVPVEVRGRQMLVCLFGEGDPSALGHAGAGKMFEDGWVWDVEGEAWQKLEDGGDGEKPMARGWFAAGATGQEGEVAVHGGLNGENERLGDVWVLRL